MGSFQQRGSFLAMDNWNEADHPRGQPSNAGQFAAGGAPGPAAAAAKKKAKPKAGASALVDRMMSSFGSFANSSAKADRHERLGKAVEALSPADMDVLRREVSGGENKPSVQEMSGVVDKMALAFNGGKHVNDIDKKNAVKHVVTALYSLSPDDLAAKPKKAKGGSLKGEVKTRAQHADAIADAWTDSTRFDALMKQLKADKSISKADAHELAAEYSGHRPKNSASRAAAFKQIEDWQMVGARQARRAANITGGSEADREADYQRAMKIGLEQAREDYKKQAGGGSLKGEPKTKAKAPAKAKPSEADMVKGLADFHEKTKGAKMYEEASKLIDGMTKGMKLPELRAFAQKSGLVLSSRASKTKIVDELKSSWLRNRRFENKIKPDPLSEKKRQSIRGIF